MLFIGAFPERCCYGIEEHGSSVLTTAGCRKKTEMRSGRESSMLLCTAAAPGAIICDCRLRDMARRPAAPCSLFLLLTALSMGMPAIAASQALDGKRVSSTSPLQMAELEPLIRAHEEAVAGQRAQLDAGALVKTMKPLLAAAEQLQGRRAQAICEPAEAHASLHIAASAQGEEVSAGAECRQMETCGVLQQRRYFAFFVVDHIRRPPMPVRWSLRSAESSASEEVLRSGEGQQVLGASGSFEHHYLLNISITEVGFSLLQVSVGEQPLQSSPFLLKCDPAPCPDRHVANVDGFCVCDTSSMGNVVVAGACWKVLHVRACVVCLCVVYVYVYVLEHRSKLAGVSEYGALRVYLLLSHVCFMYFVHCAG